MYPYCSPTGGGMTPNKELAERMERLRTDYIEACKRKDVEMQSRILKDEKEIALLIGNEGMKAMILEDKERERMPRCILVTSYEGAEAIPHHLHLDTHEVEMLRVVKKGPQLWRVFMKSGREFDTNENDFNMIERAMKERR